MHYTGIRISFFIFRDLMRKVVRKMPEKTERDGSQVNDPRPRLLPCG